MSLDMSRTIDSIHDGTKEVAEAAHVKTSEFHQKYVSKVIPDCGKYGDAARFVAEMAPSVSEYNAIREDKLVFSKQMNRYIFLLELQSLIKAKSTIMMK